MELPDADPPGPHPGPPFDLQQLELPLRATRRSWFRSHPADKEPLFFGRSAYHRFDAPADEFGTLYAGEDAFCAFIETFGHATGQNDFVTLRALADRGLAEIRPSRNLRLVDLSGSGLARLRADARLTTGSVRLAQRWALALHRHPDQPDGICYRSRHDPQRLCVAIFDRAATALEMMPHGSLADPANQLLLASILDTYGLGLLEG